MTTSDPGTQAAVVNSGTDQNAILDFTIPQGAQGATQPVQLLSAYSTPPQNGTSGNPLLFDKNGSTYGSAVSHTAGSGTFTVQQPGVYMASFNGTMSPGTGASFPLNVGTYLSQGSSTVPGAASQHTFQSSSEAATLAFTSPVTVSSAPSTLQVVGSGGPYVYGTISLTLNRLGDIPSTNA